jgi:pyruvate dehydrogenase E2 component (dihydrolipoamide acetyltransferase)
MKTIIMPRLGRSMEEGKILRWLKQEGNAVKKGESLAEVETDKGNIEVDALAAGLLRKILAAEGQTIPVGAAIALIGAVDEPLPAFAMEQ